MIIIRSELLENDIEFLDEYINVLEIKNRELFRKFTYLLNKNINSSNANEEIILLEDNNRIDMTKNIFLIYDIYNLDLNHNKILKSLYEDLNKEYNFNYSEEELIEIQCKLLENIKSILIDYDYEFTMKDFLTVKDILKALELKLNLDYYDNPMENILALFEIISTFKIYKVIVLLNAKCYFTKDELSEIYKVAKYKRINILFVEYYIDESLQPYENKTVIDNDFDEFNLKYKFDNIKDPFI